MKNINFLATISCLAFVVLFGLLLFVGYFAYPYGDDYYYAASFRGNGFDFWQTQQHYFQTWFGRITSNTFITYFNYQPIQQYFSAIVVNLLVYLAALFFFCGTVFSSLSSLKRGLISMFVFLYTIYTLPSIQEGVYWLAGFGNYHLPISLLLFAAAFVFKLPQSKHKILLTALASILLFGATTCNEIMAVMLFASFILFNIYHFFYHKNIDKILIILFLSILFGFLIMVFATGNQTRLETQSAGIGGYNILPTFAKSLFFTPFQIGKWIFHTPILPLSISYYLLLGTQRTNSFTQLKPYFVFILLFAGIFVANFVVLWGLNEEPEYRKLNTMYLFFLYCWFLLLHSLTPYVSSICSRIFISLRQKYLIVFLNMIILCSLPNVFLAMKDVRGMGSVYVYDEFMKKRIAFLNEYRGKSVVTMERIDKARLPTMFLHCDDIQYFGQLDNMNIRTYYQIDSLIAHDCWY